MAKRNKSASLAGRVPPVRGAVRKNLKIEFVVPDNPPPALFSNQMLVQSDGQATYLSFYQASPPLIFGEEPDVDKKIDELESLKAHLVAQIVVPQQRMADFVRVINGNFEAQLQSHADADNAKDSSSR